MDIELKKQLRYLVICIAVYGLAVLSQLFIDTNWIFLLIMLVPYAMTGAEVWMEAWENIREGEWLDENFLMCLATVGAFALGDYPEAVAVMVFFRVGEWFEHYAVGKSRSSISELMDIRPDYANVCREGVVQRIDPSEVNVGEMIQVKPGEKIPLDGIVVDGESFVDTSALTGESVPRKAGKDDNVFSGSVNQSGVLLINVTRNFGESTVSKILELVENASSKKASQENFITRFAHYYTPIVVALAVIVAIVPSILTGNWAEWIHRSLLFLVISCPCALVISVPLSFFGGIGGASRQGVLIKGSNYLEHLANTTTVVFDKTGTLTKGVFRVTKITPVVKGDDSTLLKLAASAEQYSSHPIAHSLQEAAKELYLDAVSDVQELAGLGIQATHKGEKLYVGNARLMVQEDVAYVEENAMGTIVYVARDKQFIGSIVISDEVKEDSRDALLKMNQLGVKRTVMLTGDAQSTAEGVAYELGVNEVYAELLPVQKVECMEEILKDQKSGEYTAFCGDGINDAPVLGRADIGIAMGAMGSDAAIEAADIVLMRDSLSELVQAIHIAKKTLRIVRQNIVFAIGVKIVFMVLGVIGFANMWEAVFADVGVTVIAILNALRALRRTK